MRGDARLRKTAGMRADGVRVAGELVAECFPDARAAWLGGSIVRGDATSSSDLDITVLTQGRPAPYRHSVHYREWPVELFVHTESSLSYYCGKDQQRRQPTMMRLVAESVVLVDTDGSGARLQQEMAVLVAKGPEPLSADELATRRYGLTDLMMDIEGGGPSRLAAVDSSTGTDSAEATPTLEASPGDEAPASTSPQPCGARAHASERGLRV